MVGVPRETIPTAHYARGVYFSLSGRSPFSRLIYPLPEAGGLGCHLTLDLAGQARFGPDVEWIDSVDYRLNPARADCLLSQHPPLVAAVAGRRAAARLCRGAPQAGRAGRAGCRLCHPGPAQHGVAGLINLYGIESPGLTSCLALAAMVGAMANQTA
jgi:L-2-hydroxyglutarate oxidase LhgO